MATTCIFLLATGTARPCQWGLYQVIHSALLPVQISCFSSISLTGARARTSMLRVSDQLEVPMPDTDATVVVRSYLELSNNNLTGTIPDEVFALERFAGGAQYMCIYICIYSLSFLGYHNCVSLSSSMVEVLLLACSLQVLSLNNNRLTGTIPSKMSCNLL
jgi:hypothetical protein